MRAAARPDAAGPIGAGNVQRDHRGAFGQPVAFVHRQAERACPQEQDGRQLGAANRGELQRARGRGAVLERGAHRGQHLRQQDDAVGLPTLDCGKAGTRIEARRAAHADFGAAAARRTPCRPRAAHRRRRRFPAAPTAAAGTDGAAIPGGASPAASARATAHCCAAAQRHALGRTGGTGSEGDLGGAGRQRGRLRLAPIEGQAFDLAGGVESGQRRAEHAVHAARAARHARAAHR